METRNKQAEGQCSTSCSVDSSHHSGCRKDVAALEESCKKKKKKELRERIKVEAESLREKKEQVNKEALEGPCIW